MVEKTLVKISPSEKSEVLKMLMGRFTDNMSPNVVSALAILSSDIDMYLGDKYDIFYDEDNERMSIVFDRNKEKQEWVWFLHNIALSIIFNSSNKVSDENLDEVSLASLNILKTLFMKKYFDLENVKLNPDAVSLAVNYGVYIDNDALRDPNNLKTEFDFIKQTLITKSDYEKLKQYKNLIELEERILKVAKRIDISNVKSDCVSCGLLKGDETLDNLFYLNNTLDSGISPEELLEVAILDAIDTSEYKSWRKINKYYRASINRLLPGVCNDEEKISQVVVFIDVSASITVDDLKKYLDIIIDVSSSNSVNKLIIIKHSVYITDIHEINLEDEEVIDEKVLLKIKNRGGTSHVKPFKQALNNKDINLEESSLIIFMSDFCSDFSSLLDSKSFKQLDIPVVCVVSKKYDTREVEIIQNHNIPTIKISE